MHGTSNASKQLAYIALVRPHWSTAHQSGILTHKKYIQETEKVQKLAARWVGGVRWVNSTNNSWTEAYNTSCINTSCIKLG